MNHYVCSKTSIFISQHDYSIRPHFIWSCLLAHCEIYKLMLAASPEQCDKEHMFQHRKEWGRWTERREAQASGRRTMLVEERCGGKKACAITTLLLASVSLCHLSTHLLWQSIHFYWIYDLLFACLFSLFRSHHECKVNRSAVILMSLSRKDKALHTRGKNVFFMNCIFSVCIWVNPLGWANHRQ